MYIIHIAMIIYIIKLVYCISTLIYDKKKYIYIHTLESQNVLLCLYDFLCMYMYNDTVMLTNIITI